MYSSYDMDNSNAIIVDIPERLDSTSIVPVISQINRYEQANNPKRLVINFSQTNFVKPGGLTPLLVYLMELPTRIPDINGLIVPSMNANVDLYISRMGFYSLYWFYRHWNKYKQTTHDEVYPFANAWFNIFTAPSLFSKIDNSIKTGKKLRRIGIAYFVCSLAAFVSIRIMENAVSEINILVSFLAWVALFLVQPAVIAFVQNEINKYNEKNNQVSKVEILNIKEAAITILGLVIVLLQIGAIKNEEQYLKNYDGYLSEYTVEQQSKIGASIGFIYRHTQGYGDFCKDEGYVLSKYPNDFSQYFSQDINDLEHSLSQYGYSLKDVTDQLMSEEFRANVKSSIYEEFYNLKKFLIMLQVAENSNLPIEQIQWDESWNNLITMNDICKIFDENGLDLLKEGENKNFLKQNKI